MSRLLNPDKNQAEAAAAELLTALSRQVASAPTALCPVDLCLSYLQTCKAQTCGKCVPCRIGLQQLKGMLESILAGTAGKDVLEKMRTLAADVAATADCALGFEAADLVLHCLDSFREDFLSHVEKDRCTVSPTQGVPCAALCPAHVDVPGYIALVREGRFADAVRLIRKDNPFPTACALICEHPCEARCRRNMLDAPVNIRGLKRYACDHAGEVSAPACASDTGKHVAVVGGGPSGLTAAYYLRLMGHAVTLYESKAQLGGMMRYGIPSYRLPRERLQEDIDCILSTGVEVRLNAPVADRESVEKLVRTHDAVYIAIGAHADKKLGIEGEDAANVIPAVRMLREIGDGMLPDFRGKKVVVVGGGNVAMDCVRSAIRLGAARASIAYRRRRADMTALPEEIDSAVAEGAELLELMAPAKIEKDENGNCRAFWVQPQIIGEIKDGRFSVSSADAPLVRLEADIIIVAIGQGIDSAPFEALGMSVKRGAVVTTRSGEVQGFPGVFAGGDCSTGPATVIRAIAQGKTAAANIDAYLGFDHRISADVEIPAPKLEDKIKRGRVVLREISSAERATGFMEAECGMSCEEACQEAGRCLRCDCFGMGTLRGGSDKQW